MKPIHDMGVAELGRAMAEKRLSSVEATTHLLARLAAHQQLGAMLATDAPHALQQAQAADAQRAAGARGALLGVPLAHKDIFVTRGLPTTAGSKMLAGYRSPFDATVVARLADSGVVTLGKLNCDEFAMGRATRTRPSARSGIPGTRRACRAGRRAARPRPSQRG